MRAMSIGSGLVVLLLVVGCGSVPVQVHRFEPGQSAVGAIYYLPRSLVKASFDVTIRRSIQDVAACAEARDSGVIEQACRRIVVDPADDVSVTLVGIATTTVPDPAAGFSIRSKGGFLTKTDTKMAFATDGQLTQADATRTNQAWELGAAGLKAVTSIAGAGVSLFRMAGASEASGLPQAAKARESIAARLAACTEALSNPRTVCPGVPADDLEKLLAMREKLSAVLADFDAQLGSNETVRVVCELDPATFQKGQGGCREEGCVGAWLDGKSTDACPEYATALKGHGANLGPRIGVAVTPRLAPTSSTLSDLHAKVSCGPDCFEGIVYRQPVWARARLIVAKPGSEGLDPWVAWTEAPVAIPQFGAFGAFNVDGGDLKASHQLVVSLVPDMGSLQAVEHHGAPVSDAAVTAAGEAVTGALQAPLDVQLQLLKARAELLEQQKRLDELEAAAKK